MPPDSAAGATGYAELTIAQARELPICPTCGIRPMELVLLHSELHDLVAEMQAWRLLLVAAVERVTAAQVGDTLTVRCEGCGEKIETSVVPGYCIRCRP